MITALERRRRMGARRQRQAQAFEIQGPYGGLNTRDALISMPLQDAVTLDNLFPSEGKVSVRKGIVEQSDIGTVTGIESIFEFHQQANRQCIACGNNRIYNASSASASDISDGGAPYSNDRWDAVNFSGVMPMVNGADAPRQWNGTTMTTPTWSGIADPTTLAGVHAYKFRLYFWTGQDQSFWYGGASAILGTLTEFDLSEVAGIGGNIINIDSWSTDAGDGQDDRIAIIFDSGIVVIYTGSNPGSDFSIVGIYKIPEPLGGTRCSYKVGNDLLIVTKADIVPLSEMIRKGFIANRSKISGLIRQQAVNHGSSFGWGIMLHPEGHMLVINQPDYNQDYNQLVMNTMTGAWCRFVDIDPLCWATYNGNLICGGQDGKVYKLTGQDDAGSAIECNAVQAWSKFGVDADKHITGVRPLLIAQGAITYSFDIGFDFGAVNAVAATSTASTGTPWGSPWGSPWSSGIQVINEWKGAAGMGQYVTSNLKISALQNISWLKTDYLASLSKTA